MTEKVLYEELCPAEFQERLQACPVAYLPLGTLEWHGPHLPLGADGIQSQEHLYRWHAGSEELYCQSSFWVRTGFTGIRKRSFTEWISVQAEL